MADQPHDNHDDDEPKPQANIGNANSHAERAARVSKRVPPDPASSRSRLVPDDDANSHAKPAARVSKRVPPDPAPSRSRLVPDDDANSHAEPAARVSKRVPPDPAPSRSRLVPDDDTDDTDARPRGGWPVQQLLFTLGVFYGVVAAVAAAIRWVHFGSPMYVGDLDVMSFLGAPTLMGPPLVWPLAAGLALAVIAVWGSSAMVRSSWGRGLVATLKQALGDRPSWGVALAAGVSSGFAEELLFRGALQPGLGELGWLWSSLLFAALHSANTAAADPMRRKGEVDVRVPHTLGAAVRLVSERFGWAEFALGAGLVLAGLYAWGQNLWPCIAAHIVLNTINIHRLGQIPLPAPAEDSDDGGGEEPAT